MRRARLVISHDSGFVHVANLTRDPRTVITFSVVDSASRWRIDHQPFVDSIAIQDSLWPTHRRPPIRISINALKSLESRMAEGMGALASMKDPRTTALDYVFSSDLTLSQLTKDFLDLAPDFGTVPISELINSIPTQEQFKFWLLTARLSEQLTQEMKRFHSVHRLRMSGPTLQLMSRMAWEQTENPKSIFPNQWRSLVIFVLMSYWVQVIHPNSSEAAYDFWESYIPALRDVLKTTETFYEPDGKPAKAKDFNDLKAMLARYILENSALADLHRDAQMALPQASPCMEKLTRRSPEE